nr:hypothetical protein [Tanacetum cinerariifolium]
MKAIIHHFMSKDLSIPRRNKVNWHYVRDDHMFSSIKLVSKHQNTQQFGALLPIELTIDEIRNSKAYKEYYVIATGEAAPKPKASVRRTRSSSDTSIAPPTTTASPRLIASAKAKQTAKASKAKSADEGTSSKPAVPDVPTEELKEELSWNSIDVEGDDNEEKDVDGDEEDEGNDCEEGNGDDDDEDDDGEEGDGDDNDQEVGRDDDKDDDEQEYDEEEEYAKETRDKESFYPILQTLKDSEDEGDGKEDLGLNVGKEERYVEEEKEEEDEHYSDVNINQGSGIQATLEVEDSHVILTPVNPDGQQESSSVSSQFTPTSVASLPMTAPTLTPSTIATITTTSQAPILPTTVLSNIIQNLPSFGSLFRFDDRLRSLEVNFSEAMQTNQFTGAVSAILGIVHQYMDQRMNEAVKVTVQIQSGRLQDEAQRDNDVFLKTIDENIKKIIKEQVKEQVEDSYTVATDLFEMELKKILIKKMEGNKSIQRSDEQRNLYKALVEDYESDKIILDTYRETVTLKRRRDDDADKDEEPSAGPDRGSKRHKEGKEPESASTLTETATRSAGRSTQGSRSRQVSTSESTLAEEPMQTISHMEEPSHLKPPSPDRAWNKTVAAVYESIQPWISELTKQADTRSSFNELMDTPLDFSNFLINRLKVDTLTPKLLAGPTYELMKGSCKSLVELKYHLEEVFKVTTDQLDWVNPEGQQYPHNLLKPLPLIPNNRGRRVIPFEHFINNDLEYLRGGASSRKYTTSIMKTKAADYGHIKWIEDLVPRTLWMEEPIGYDKHALWWRRIIVVTKLKIVEWHSYKHLDSITVRRDDDKVYKFKEGDFKRLRIQDIKDMLLFLVQGKLTNLTVKERIAFNVSLRMFTKRIVIQRRVEDLQLGVESYQKKLNLNNPDSYRSNLKCKEAYNAYSNLRGFIYQNKDKRNRLIQIDELHNLETGRSPMFVLL